MSAGLSTAMPPAAAPGPSAVGVIFGGPSPLHDESVRTGLAVASELVARRGVGQVVPLHWMRSGQFSVLTPGAPATEVLEGAEGTGTAQLRAGPEGGFELLHAGRLGRRQEHLPLGVVVNCCHGGPGQDGVLQSALSLAGLPFTGPSVAGAALCADRLALGALLGSHGVPMWPAVLVEPGAAQPSSGIPEGPYVVRPRFGVVADGAEAAPQWADVVRFLELAGPRAGQGLLAQPASAHLFSLSVGVRAFPVLEPSPVGPGAVEGMDKVLEEDLQQAALTVARVGGARGIWRVDFLFDARARQWWVDSVDTVPAGLGFDMWPGDGPGARAGLLHDMLEEASRRPGSNF